MQKKTVASFFPGHGVYLMNFSGVNESEKKFQDIFDDKNDVRHLMLYIAHSSKRWRTSFLSLKISFI